MSHRNLSPQKMWTDLAREHKPLYAFNGKTPEDFQNWKDEALPKVIATMGDMPERVPPIPELQVEFEHDGLRKQRWILDAGQHISMVVQVNIPPEAENKKTPAILCWHGHGEFGKEPVMGDDSFPAIKQSIVDHNYNYGHQMAKKGYVTFGIDWMGLGQRGEQRITETRDWCNLLYLNATLLGTTPLAMNVTHGMIATDFVCTLPQVDADRLGVMGLSGGGTMTTWSGLFDERLKAVEIIGYSGLFAEFAIAVNNCCGMQITPGLFKLVDLPDLQGLIAPKPLLVDIGAYDRCFPVNFSMQCQKKLEKIYEAAGLSDDLHLDLFPGPHAWGGNKSEGFFGKYLG